jgi:hypothetical protein
MTYLDYFVLPRINLLQINEHGNYYSQRIINERIKMLTNRKRWRTNQNRHRGVTDDTTDDSEMKRSEVNRKGNEENRNSSKGSKLDSPSSPLGKYPWQPGYKAVT